MRKYFLILFVVTGLCSYGQKDATVREYNKVFTTYPYSDPDPVPNPGSLFYPYFRFDGYTDHSVQKEWKVVELENDFIKLMVMPQIGGKIWTAIDKKNGKPFIYNNDAIKFRDIAMRGPWTSGGLEANFGIFGHTPGVAAPVDYLTRKNEDGSVSCIISLPDLLTQTRWNLEILLPRDKAYFITRAFWHNGTSLPQPYYSWMNLGEKVSDSLEYIFPGNHYIFHDGKLYDWPENPDNKKKISIYDQNNFGGYKSYHVTGVYSKYFGVFWQKENFGMVHFADRQDKIGKKIWIWGFSRQGMIWEDLLTDHSGQYSEIQSGRLYNQNAPESVLTPFKQFDFAPYNTDTWSEYWYPFSNTEGVSYADLNGVMHISNSDGKAILSYSAAGDIRDTLKVWDTKQNLIIGVPVQLKPLESFRQEVPLKEGQSIGMTFLAGSEVHLPDSAARVLDRPLESYPAFDWNTAYGWFLKGQYQSGTRHYAAAEQDIRESLLRERAFLPSLSQMAFLQYRKMNYDSAFYFAKMALSIDTYDPASNYYYGLAANKLGKIYDAKDGFQVAVITPRYRSAAYTELSKIELKEKHFPAAYAYAQKSLVTNEENISALKIQYVCARIQNDTREQDQLAAIILRMDPLNHFVRFEQYLKNKNGSARAAFTDGIRNELPTQTYLDLATWYNQFDLTRECGTVLEICPEKNPEVYYWLAWLNRDNEKGKVYLDTADRGDPDMVFPYREESRPVMQWAYEKTASWKSRYYLALIYAAHDQRGPALALLYQGSAPSGYAPFYVLRSGLQDPARVTEIQQDLQTARKIEPGDWRYGKYLASFWLAHDRPGEAENTIGPYYQKDPKNYMAGLLYCQCLMRNGKYAEAEKILGKIRVLPYEGAADAHRFYEKTKLMLALQYMENKKFTKAAQKIREARQWPENLGAGAPYPDMVDNSVENEMERWIDQAGSSHKPTPEGLEDFRKKISEKENKNP
jgi:Tfp pilus assembly protein PilF